MYNIDLQMMKSIADFHSRINGFQHVRYVIEPILPLFRNDALFELTMS